MKNVEIGREYKSVKIVKKEELADYVGSGDLEVFATPMVIALMENAAANLVKNYLEEGFTTVGTRISIGHINPTLEGVKTEARAKLLNFDGKKFSFQVEASDESGIIAKGEHERFIVNIEKFKEKALKRKLKNKS